MSTHEQLWNTLVTTGSQPELAEYMLATWRAKGDCVYERGFYLYDHDSGTWSGRDDDACKREILALDGRTYGAKTFTRTGEVKQSRIRMSDRMCNSVFRVAATLATPRVAADEPGFFDKAPHGVLCKGSFLTIEGGDVVARPPKASDRQRVALSVAYNPAATCPRWQRALGDWFGSDASGVEKSALLAEFVGAALFGVAVTYQKALFLVAPGGNGKSQLLDVVSALFPEGYVKAIRPQDWGNEYQRAELAGAMINIVAELPTKAIAEGSNFKAIITGDPIGARRIYEKPFTYRPRCAHIISGNAFPDALDTSDGFWRRLLVLTMTRRFDGTPDEVRDLAQIIIREELEGVLAWAAAGAKRLIANNGYTIPSSSQAAVSSWRKESDPVAMWIEQRTNSSSEGSPPTQTSELFLDYRSWSETYCFPVSNLNNFSKALVRILGSPKRRRSGCFHQVTLKSRTEL
jgi:P4 family phage/plasmid primase-like protien